MMQRLTKGIPLLFLIIFSGLSWAQEASTDKTSLNIISTRKHVLMEPVIEAYTKEYGVQINFIQVSRQEMQDNFAHNARTKVDIYLANDMAVLYDGELAGAFRAVSSDMLSQNVPSYYRSSENLWFASTSRARAIIYNPAKVKASELLSYAALSTPIWNKRLCLRNGYSEYNLFLVSSLIHRYGRDNTLKILQGWKNNLAIPLTNKDSVAIKKVASGECDVTIANHYYFTRLKEGNPDFNAAIFWPNQKAQGVHMGMSGFALAKESANADMAIAFMEWLSSQAGQKLLTDNNDEFPINPKVSQSKAAAILGSFKKDNLSLDALVDDLPIAKELIDEVGLHL